MCAHVKASSWLAQHTCMLRNIHVWRNIHVCSWIVQHACWIHVDMLFFATCNFNWCWHAACCNMHVLNFATCNFDSCWHACFRNMHVLNYATCNFTWCWHAFFRNMQFELMLTYAFLCNMNVWIMQHAIVPDVDMHMWFQCMSTCSFIWTCMLVAVNMDPFSWWFHLASLRGARLERTGRGW